MSARFENLAAPESLRVLSDASCSAVIVDPPYCSGANQLTGRGGNPMAKYSSSDAVQSLEDISSWTVGDANRPDNLLMFSATWMREAARVVGTGYMFCFTDWRSRPFFEAGMIAAGWNSVQILIWRKNAGRPAPFRWQSTYEIILFASINEPTHDKKNAQYMGSNVLEHNVVQAKAKRHQSEKPVTLLRELMDVLPKHDRRPVLDPFAGSCSLAIAAAESGRDSICFDVDGRHLAAGRSFCLTQNIKEDASLGTQTVTEFKAPEVKTSKVEQMALAWNVLAPQI